MFTTPTMRLITGKRALLFWAAALLLIASAFIACNRLSGTGYFRNIEREPETISSASPASNKIRIVSLNMFFRLYDRNARLERTLEIFREMKPDIIALQEVSAGLLLGRDAAEFLAGELNYNLARFYLEDTGAFFKHSLVVLSRWPIESSEGEIFSRDLPMNKKGFMRAVVASPYGRVNVVNLHMAATRKENLKLAQAEDLIKYIKRLEPLENLVLAGDFNEELHTAPMKKIIEELNLLNMLDATNAERINTCAPRYGKRCNDKDGEMIDFIFFHSQAAESGRIKIKSGGILAPVYKPYPSDHCFIWADFRIMPSSS